MRRGWIALALLAGCSRTTELLPEKVVAGEDAAVSDAYVPVDTVVVVAADTLPDTTADQTVEPPARTKYPFCPTTLDVYAGTNGLLLGCGNNYPGTPPSEEGLNAPGTPAYDGSLAGRLGARLVGDPDLLPRFGPAWSVRSCATPGQTLTQLVPSITSDLCGRSAPEYMGNATFVCGKNPAPLLLLSTTMADDGCHGGFQGSSDPAGYIQHFLQRLDAFLASRQPQFALVGAQPEWTSVFPPLTSGGDECDWQRPDWDAQAVQIFGQNYATPVAVLPDQHASFIRHHRCCRQLNVGGCATSWYTKGDVLNCDGAQALVDHWYQALKAFLTSNDFECP